MRRQSEQSRDENRVTRQQHRGTRDPVADKRRARRADDSHHARDSQQFAGMPGVESGERCRLAREGPDAADRHIEGEHATDHQRRQKPPAAAATVVTGRGLLRLLATSSAQGRIEAARKRRRDQREHGQRHIQGAQAERFEQMRQHDETECAGHQLTDYPQAIHARAAAERGQRAQHQQCDEARHEHRRGEIAEAKHRRGDRRDTARVDTAQP
ncbi:hypothetical protein KCU90_g7045, partial [Aureobasidium melanogenum]